MPPERVTAQCESADPAAWLADHGDALYAFAVARLRDRDLAEELVQDTLLTALRRRESFEGRSTLRTWLIGILRNRILEHRRTVARRGTPIPLDHPDGFLDRFFGRDGRWKTGMRPWKADPAGVLESREFRAALDACLDDLPVRAGDALVLRVQQEMPLETVASILEVSANNLSVILHRARTALRECLESRQYGAAGGER